MFNISSGYTHTHTQCTIHIKSIGLHAVSRFRSINRLRRTHQKLSHTHTLLQLCVLFFYVYGFIFFDCFLGRAKMLYPRSGTNEICSLIYSLWLSFSSSPHCRPFIDSSPHSLARSHSLSDVDVCIFFDALLSPCLILSLSILLLLLLYVYGLLVPVVFFFHAPALQMTHTKNANARAPMYIQKTIECQCMRFCLRWQIV